MSNKNERLVRLVWPSGVYVDDVRPQDISALTDIVAQVYGGDEKPTIVDNSPECTDSDCPICKDFEEFEKQIESWPVPDLEKLEPGYVDQNTVQPEPDTGGPDERTYHDIRIDDNLALCVTAQIYADFFANRDNPAHLEYVKLFVSSFHNSHG